MEPKLQSSFIPKKPVSSNTEFKQRGKPMGLIFFISLVVFLGALGTSAGLFFYQAFLKGSIEQKTQELERARAAFTPAQIQELQRLDERLKTAGNLLEGHVATSLLFDFLEETTIANVQFDDFQYAALSDGQVSITIDGAARGFTSIALQSDLYKNESLVQGPIFSGLNLDDEGNAIFNLNAGIDPSAISYTRLIVGDPELVPEEEVEEVATTSPESTEGGEAEVSSGSESESSNTP